MSKNTTVKSIAEPGISSIPKDIGLSLIISLNSAYASMHERAFTGRLTPFGSPVVPDVKM